MLSWRHGIQDLSTSVATRHGNDAKCLTIKGRIRVLSCVLGCETNLSTQNCILAACCHNMQQGHIANMTPGLRQAYVVVLAMKRSGEAIAFSENDRHPAKKNS